MIEEVEGEAGDSLTPAARFEWTAAGEAPGPNGGARAIPKGTWKMPGKQHSVRTDYPGAIVPSEQVLGPRHEPFTLTGRWDDRYNFEGYAVQEKRRFEDLCRRGKAVRITFEDEVFEGLITDWAFDRRRSWDITYSFTFSNHGRPGQAKALPVATPVASAPLAADRVLIIAQATIAQHAEAPASAMAGSSKSSVDTVLEGMSTKLNALGEQIDAAGPSVLRPITTFKRIAAELRSIGGDAFEILDKLVAIRSDTELAVRTAMSVLDFEVWRRATCFQTRLLLGQANQGAFEMDQRAEADPIQVYRPFKGESLYAVSRRFYGTPHSWRLIANRNGLQSISLDGTEVLMIPVRGEG